MDIEPNVNSWKIAIRIMNANNRSPRAHSRNTNNAKIFKLIDNKTHTLRLVNETRLSQTVTVTFKCIFYSFHFYRWSRVAQMECYVILQFTERVFNTIFVRTLRRVCQGSRLQRQRCDRVHICGTRMRRTLVVLIFDVP